MTKLTVTSFKAVGNLVISKLIIIEDLLFNYKMFIFCLTSKRNIFQPVYIFIFVYYYQNIGMCAVDLRE